MSDQSIRRRARLLAEAEGYVALEMYPQALAALDAIADPSGAEFEIYFQRGDILRHQEQHAQALVWLQRASDLKPDNVDLLMAMAWCYKRTAQLPRAITSMEQAYRIAPQEPIVLYNLSCYWALAGNKTQALSWLGRALRLDKDLRRLIDRETDFDSLRQDSDFLKLIGLVTRDPA